MSTRVLAVRLLTAATAVVAAGALLCGALAPRGDAAATFGVELVKDVNTSGDGSPSDFTVIGTSLYFRATDSSHGTELWKSDGTAAGTVLVKDINLGTGHSSPSNLAAVGSTLYFAATNGTNGRELWKSDGTEAGTTMVKDIYLGSNGSSPEALTAFNGSLYFRANDGIHGYELWKSNGTEAGTVMVKDINPTAASNPNWLTAYNGSLYFTANDGTHGQELWRSDGIPEASGGTTQMVKDINTAGTASSDPYGPIVFNSILYFGATDGTRGYELWKSDGTEAGTDIVKDINTGSGSGSPYDLVALGTSLYFEATDGTSGNELWKSDGTEAGTDMVKDIYDGGDGSPAGLTAFNGALYFQAINGADGNELWKSDGTAAGTVMVKDINPGIDDGDPKELTVLNGILFFSATVTADGAELWKSDGSAAGTVMVANINPIADDSSNPRELTPFAGKLYFTADDGTHGDELWRAGDFSPPETQIDSGPSGATADSTPTFGFSSDEPGSFECSTDGGGYSACVSPATIGPLADGAHTFRVRAIDQAENVDASPAERAFSVDTAAPDTSITSGPKALIRKKTASFSFSSPEASAVFECRRDGAGWAACSSPKSYAGLSEGTHSFNVRAKDQLGNADATPSSRAFRVDTRRPQTKITKHPKKLVFTKKVRTKVRFVFRSSEKGSRLSCKLDKGKWKACKSPKSYKVKPGKHTVRVRAIDKAGNVDKTPAKWVWKVKQK